MGHKELIESLQQKGEEKIRQLWEDAEAEAETVRTHTSDKIARTSQELRNSELKELQEQKLHILSDAVNKAGRIKLKAEKTLSDKLFTLALVCLDDLRNEHYREVFSSLVKEIPASEWKEVRVHPDDIKIAAEYFPASDIVPDRRIRGGLETVSPDEKVFIINTFDKRLERAWDELLPLLTSHIYSEVLSGTGSDS